MATNQACTLIDQHLLELARNYGCSRVDDVDKCKPVYFLRVAGYADMVIAARDAETTGIAAPTTTLSSIAKSRSKNPLENYATFPLSYEWLRRGRIEETFHNGIGRYFDEHCAERVAGVQAELVSAAQQQHDAFQQQLVSADSANQRTLRQLAATAEELSAARARVERLEKADLRLREHLNDDTESNTDSQPGSVVTTRPFSEPVATRSVQQPAKTAGVWPPRQFSAVQSTVQAMPLSDPSASRRNSNASISTGAAMQSVRVQGPASDVGLESAPRKLYTAAETEPRQALATSPDVAEWKSEDALDSDESATIALDWLAMKPALAAAQTNPAAVSAHGLPSEAHRQEEMDDDDLPVLPRQQRAEGAAMTTPAQSSSRDTMAPRRGLRTEY